MVQASWIPGWYELDQPVAVGREEDFFFWRVVPEQYARFGELVFYNDLWRPKDAVTGRGRISAIHNPIVGDVREINTSGLSYTISLADGSDLLVNAEEEPGKIYRYETEGWVESSREIGNWRFTVEIPNLGPLGPAA